MIGLGQNNLGLVAPRNRIVIARTEVLDHLTPDQRRALDALAFRMAACDRILDDAIAKVKIIADLRFGEEITSRTTTALVGDWNDAIVNLGILIDMCKRYEQKQFSEVLNSLHDRRHYEVPAPPR
jgi:hypothetical protein